MSTLLKKISIVAFYLFLIIGLGLIGYLGLSMRAAQVSASPVAPAQVSQSDETIPLSDCQTSLEKICLVSTGSDVEGNLLLNLKVSLAGAPQLLAVVRDEGREVTFTCQSVSLAPGSVYCLGPFSGNGSPVMVEIYLADENRLLAAGSLSEFVEAAPFSEPLVELNWPTETLEPEQDTAADPDPDASDLVDPDYPSDTSYPDYP